MLFADFCVIVKLRGEHAANPIKGERVSILKKDQRRQEFYACIQDLIQSPQVQSMGDIPQHTQEVSRLDHSLYVSYVGFLLCRFFGLDQRAAARGGLLHDMHNWTKDETFALRARLLVLHPQLALKNASGAFDLSQKEKDIIVKHMWPLTPAFPRYAESYLICLADKLCACAEMLHLYRIMRIEEKLRPAFTVA